MATTTNYGWTTPDDTALVKDGASAIRSLGSSIDTTTKALNPSTTLGDIEYRSSTANTNTRLPIGTSGQVLTVSSGVPAWTTISAGGMTQLASGSLSGSELSLTSISSAYNNLFFVATGVSKSSNSSQLRLRINNVSTATSYQYNGEYFDTALSNSGYGGNADYIGVGGDMGWGAAYSNNRLIIRIANYADSTGCPIAEGVFGFRRDASNNTVGRFVGNLKDAAAVTGLNLLLSTGTFDAGTYILYGVK